MQRPANRAAPTWFPPSAAQAWERSRQAFADLCLASPQPSAAGISLPPGCLVACGSLARMELHEASDLDLLFLPKAASVASEVVPPDGKQESPSTTISSADIAQRLSALSGELGFSGAKAGGIFAKPVTVSSLIREDDRGRLDETPERFGHRIQLLIDSQPVTGDSEFLMVQERILQWYLAPQGELATEMGGPFGWLIQDTERYWRSLWSRAFWISRDAPDNQLRIQVKLLSTRRLLITAFLSVLQHASTCRNIDEGVAETLELLHLTPAERIAAFNGERTNLSLAYAAVLEWLRITATAPDTPHGGMTVPDSIRGALREIETGCAALLQPHADQR